MKRPVFEHRIVAPADSIDELGHGAMEAGDHLFYERKGGGPEKLAGKARFAMVWKWQDGQWKLSRVLSYAHGAAEP